MSRAEGRSLTVVKAKVEATKKLPPNFRPIHDRDKVEGWKDVPIKVRGSDGLVLGAARTNSGTRLFVRTANSSFSVMSEEVEIMQETTVVDDGLDHSQEIIADEEPEGGWVTAPTLLTGEIQSLVLCKYSGDRPMESVAPGTLQCQARTLRLHKDEACFVFFHNAAAILSGAIEVSAEDLLIAEETVRTGDEITYRNPIT